MRAMKSAHSEGRDRFARQPIKPTSNATATALATAKRPGVNQARTKWASSGPNSQPSDTPRTAHARVRTH